ncbi:DUF1990 family protein [Microbacterium sediminis]|uniref:DUF1990 domain-containing protein n=1 Tax=Microbacterium sediminis TaxID=904291 RepID=A0A1B9NGT6_9MICO|nr:DUF1990 family protein [Microbacterium sediminis]OCG75815.1 hypothetical protein A7J15_01875 [Microbacterium sediminis]QBR74206.1 DUF1990 family protein [Microbacterium sediminis]
MRRGTFRDETVDYAAVGGSQADDLLQYPPEKSLPAIESMRIGSGEERFRTAAEELLSWGAQRGASIRVAEVRPAAGPAYTGVSFDGEGNPIAPAGMEGEQRFDAEGTPLVSAGATVKLQGRVRGHHAGGEYRVIFVVEEKRRVGFALGTVGGAVVSGEESFMIEWRDNDEVWFSVRAFDRPTRPLGRLFPGLVRRRRRALFDRYLRAISPLFATPS